MKKTKILALALAGALACPQVAFAARDGDGMEYTSAAEGFYGSLRTMYSSSDGGEKDKNSTITGDGSRLGIRGTHDLGHGLTGIYRYEFTFNSEDDGANSGKFRTRLHYVGLKGSFGQVEAGALWENDYNWVTAATDAATTGSGNFAPHFRRSHSLQYTSPNLNGFQGSFRVMMDGGNDKGTNLTVSLASPLNGVHFRAGSNADGTGDIVVNDNGSSENVDEWALVAQYKVRGFTIAGAYETRPDRLVYTANVGSQSGADTANAIQVQVTPKREDATFWAVRGGYGQDNWAVNAWYGVHNTGDLGVNPADLANTDDLTQENINAAARKRLKPEDTTVFSMSGSIDVGKVGLVIVHENRENEWGLDDNATVFNVNYHFTPKSRVYGAYIARDYDSDAKQDDEVRIGMRLDF